MTDAAAVAAYRWAEAVFADPLGAAGIDYSDAIRILRQVEQTPLLAAAQARASNATLAAGATATPPAAAPGQLDPRWVKTTNDSPRDPTASADDDLRTPIGNLTPVPGTRPFATLDGRDPHADDSDPRGQQQAFSGY
jgi:hypothetical protein